MPQLTGSYCETGKDLDERRTNATFKGNKRRSTRDVPDLKATRHLRRTLAEWPLVSAPMAEALTGASRAAVQRNLAWMEERDLIREVTGQGRFRMWRASA